MSTPFTVFIWVNKQLHMQTIFLINLQIMQIWGFVESVVAHTLWISS